MRRTAALIALGLMLPLGPAASQDGRGRDRRGRDRAPQVGAEAPDFELPRLVDGKASEDPKERVRLSRLRGKPVVLIFGSYT